MKKIAGAMLMLVLLVSCSAFGGISRSANQTTNNFLLFELWPQFEDSYYDDSVLISEDIRNLLKEAGLLYVPIPDDKELWGRLHTAMEKQNTLQQEPRVPGHIFCTFRWYREGFEELYGVYSMFSQDTSEEMAEILNELIQQGVKVNAYEGKIPSNKSIEEVLSKLNAQTEYTALFPVNGRQGLQPFIELTYCYDNSGGDYHANSFSSLPLWIEIGVQRCDDVFLPILEEIEEKGLLYKHSGVRERGSGFEEFTRSLVIYLTEPIEDSLATELEKNWKEQIGAHPYAQDDVVEAFVYEPVPYFPVTLLSQGEISEQEWERLGQDSGVSIALPSEKLHAYRYVSWQKEIPELYSPPYGFAPEALKEGIAAPELYFREDHEWDRLSDVPVYMGPGENYEQTDVLLAGTPFYRIGYMKEGPEEWLLVQYGGAWGWIREDNSDWGELASPIMPT